MTGTLLDSPLVIRNIGVRAARRTIRILIVNFIVVCSMYLVAVFGDFEAVHSSSISFSLQKYQMYGMIVISTEYYYPRYGAPQQW
ncbi:MAG: hypothetical protein M3270_09925 [Thermoproteota archaeon]|nr:hypothetical protein [Thermoproteota archaeon]